MVPNTVRLDLILKAQLVKDDIVVSCGEGRCSSSRGSAVGLNFFQAELPFLAYASVSFPPTILAGGLSVVAGIYSEYFGISLALITALVMVAGLFDAITDPLIGFFSDIEHNRTGSRRIVIYSGMILMIPSSWFLFVPVLDASGVAKIPILIASYLCFYWAYTCYFIPHLAWPSNLASDRKKRSKYFGYRLGVILLGGAVFFLIPLLPVFPSSKITPDVLRVSVIVGILLMIPAMIVLKKYSLNESAKTQMINDGRKGNLSTYMGTIISNSPFVFFILSHLIFGLGSGGFFGLMFIYVNSFLGLGEYFPHMMLFYMLVGVLVNPVIVYFCTQFEDRRSMLIGILFKTSTFVLYACPLLWDLLPSVEIASLLIGNFTLAISLNFLNVAYSSMLASIADYDRLKTKTSRSGIFFSADHFLKKVGSVSLGPVLGLGVVALFGFDPSDPQFGERETLGFIIAMALIPIPLTLMSYFLFLLIPLSPRKQLALKRRLESLDRRAALGADGIP